MTRATTVTSAAQATTRILLTGVRSVDMTPPCVWTSDGIGACRRAGRGSSSRRRELHACQLAERPPGRRLAAGVEDLVVWPAETQPGVHAGPQARVRAKEAVGHLQRRQLLGVEHLPLADEQPEALTAQRHERRQRRRAGAVLEEERGRVVEPADAERPLDEADRAVVAR